MSIPGRAAPARPSLASSGMTIMHFSETATRLRYRLIPDHMFGELLSKRWSDNAIPFVLLLLVIVFMGTAIPNFHSAVNLSDTSRQFGEFGLVTIAMMVVMVAGGIDLSVSSVYALANIVSLALLNVAGWPIYAVIPTTLLIGASIGLVNGLLIGYLRLRAFLTTLVTLIIVRAIVDLLLLKYAVEIAGAFIDSELWYFIGEGSVFGLPVSFIILIVIATLLHVVLSRMRLGWRIMAVGGSRRSAHNVGIRVERIVCITYVASGTLASLAGMLFATRLSGAGADTGLGLEIMALTAAVLGGNSLGGGRGSVAKALMGALAVLLLVNGLVRLGLPAGASSVGLGFVLLAAVAIDVRWLKNRHKILARVYVSPTYMSLPAAPDTSEAGGGRYALNNRLRDVELIGLGTIDGPEDVILDRNDNLYCGTRVGDIVRFNAPDYTVQEIFAHVGGRPLGMAFDRSDNLILCIGGMGLYSVSPDRQVTKLTDETNRSKNSIIDDSRLKLADDLDIAPDGKIYFSEATIRYEMHDWPVDALEGRGNGRIICYDPATKTTRTLLRNLVFPNGICMAHDNRSFFYAETWGCRVSRYWLDGPKTGRSEPVIPDLPGYPDNINRASDGTYWLAVVGIRTPSLDLAMKMPGFRKRMARRVAADEWLFPNINTGCVLRFDDQGNVLETLWDFGGVNHPMITSMREHRGYLYLGGISNNRIGRLKLAGADPGWRAVEHYWCSK
jgi:ribose transport system permease protein